MFIERRVVERHLLGVKGMLIFCCQIRSMLTQDNSPQAVTAEVNVSRGAVTTFQFS